MARVKKAKSRTASSRGKAKGPGKSVAAYLDGIPEPARTTLQKVRAAIRSAAPPEAREILSYGIPAFHYKGVLVWFAAFSKHCSLFPTHRVIEQFKDELKGFPVSKGTIQFPLDKPLPAALIRRLVRARVAQIEAQARR